ncbi:MAG TPA: helix-turn-helix transcriptional regulator [Candidatus Limnocylindrales bacterium]|nr:helix-turn-helix transcriptional regulator [Candidatus Limnocylindrales bacterium]
MRRDTLGELEHQVLLAVLRLGEGAYSVSVVEELERSAAREVAQAAVFITLRRLEGRGLLTSRIEEGGGGEGGARVRRYFRLTEPGLERLRETRQALTRLWSGFEQRLDDGSS